ncbi:MAG: glycosyltransferase family 1 protein [Bdellovibrionota bacterium]
MKVLIDARKLGDGGIGVYIENLVDGLLALSKSGEIDIALSLLVSEAFFESDNQSAFSTHYRTHGLGAVFDAVKLRWLDRVRYISESAPKYSLREYFLLGFRQRRELAECDLFHSPHFTLPYFLRVPSVVTIHDIIHCSHPENFYHRPVAKSLIRSALRRADQIITVSEDSARCIQAQFGKFRMPAAVIPNAMRPNLARKPEAEVEAFLRKEFLTHDYCLYVGSERAHKGFWELLDAWAELTKDGSLARCPDLVVVGKQFSVARDKVHEMGLDTTVRFFGEVSLDKLALLYSGASAVVVPSKVEGFGLPALEGMGLGVPVVCAPIASLREVCGDAAVYASEHSGHGFAAAIRKLFSDSSSRSEVSRRGIERAQQFSVEECARKTFAVYQRVLGIRPQSVSSGSAAEPVKKLQTA